ncbi:MAG: hypothetical protein ABJK39_01355 [Hyphomicrobiales bacterium]
MQSRFLKHCLVFCAAGGLLAGCAAQKELAGDDGAIFVEVEDAAPLEVGGSLPLSEPKSKTRIKLSKSEQEELARRGNAPNVTLSNKARASYCPKLEVLNGTGVLTAYIDGGDDEPSDVTHQASFTKTGRECKKEGDVLNIRVGVAGRAVKGPKSLSNSVLLPVRVAVVRNNTEVISSQIYPQQVNFTNAIAQGFTFVEENLQIPFPQEENLKVLVGFDVKGDAQVASSQDDAQVASSQN